MLKESIGHPLLSISPLGAKVIGWTSRTKGSVKGVQRTSFMSISPLGTKVMGWTCRTKGSIKGVHRTSFTFH